MNEEKFKDLIAQLSRGHPDSDLSIGYDEDANMVQRYRQILNVLPNSPKVTKWIFNGVITSEIISVLFLPLPQEEQAEVLPSTIYDSRISNLDLSYAYIQPQSLERLCLLLEGYRNLESLSLRGKASFSPDAIAAIFRALIDKNALREVKILNVKLDSTAVDHLCTILTLPNIRELNLSGCQVVQAQDLPRLMNAVNRSAITKLFLPSVISEFAVDIYKDIAQMLAENKSLQELGIRNLDAKSLNYIAQALSKSKTIKSAKFYACKFKLTAEDEADATVIGFEKYLAMSALQKLELDFSENVHPVDSDKILTTLARSLDLKALRLSNFVFSSDEIDFSQALNANSTLHDLTFGNVDFLDSSLAVMVKVLSESKSLTNIKFSGSFSAHESSEKLIEIAQKNPNILKMEVKDLRGSEVAEEINQQCEENQYHAQSAAAAIRDAWYSGFSREIIVSAIPRVAAILSILDTKTSVDLHDYAVQGIFDILKKLFPDRPHDEIVGYDERKIIMDFASKLKPDPAFVKTGLEIILEQFQEAEKQRAPKEDLAEFILDKFQNAKFPRDWNQITAATLSRAVVAYLHDQQQGGGAAKRPRLDATKRDEKIQKLLRNGLQSHHNYEEIMTTVNSEFGVTILPVLESVEEKELQGILNPEALENLVMHSRRDFTDSRQRGITLPS